MPPLSPTTDYSQVIQTFMSTCPTPLSHRTFLPSLKAFTSFKTSNHPSIRKSTPLTSSLPPLFQYLTITLSRSHSLTTIVYSFPPYCPLPKRSISFCNIKSLDLCTVFQAILFALSNDPAPSSLETYSTKLNSILSNSLDDLPPPPRKPPSLSPPPPLGTPPYSAK